MGGAWECGGVLLMGFLMRLMVVLIIVVVMMVKILVKMIVKMIVDMVPKIFRWNIMLILVELCLQMLLKIML